MWRASVWDCVAHFTGHGSQTGGYGNSWHWTGKDWRLSSVHILFTGVIKWSYSIVSLVFYIASNLLLVLVQWYPGEDEKLPHLRCDRMWYIWYMIQVQCQCMYQRREILLHQINMNSNECQRNVQKKEEVVLWQFEDSDRHVECQREADEDCNDGAGIAPALSPPRHLSSWNIAHHKHYRCRNIKYLLVSHQNEESPQ